MVAWYDLSQRSLTCCNAHTQNFTDHATSQSFPKQTTESNRRGEMTMAGWSIQQIGKSANQQCTCFSTCMPKPIKWNSSRGPWAGKHKWSGGNTEYWCRRELRSIPHISTGNIESQHSHGCIALSFSLAAPHLFQCTSMHTQFTWSIVFHVAEQRAYYTLYLFKIQNFFLYI